MPEIANFAKFDADVADDFIEGDATTPDIPGGAGLLREVRSRLLDQGLSVTQVEQHKFYGWAFDVHVGRVSVWCMVQGGDPWLLITEASSGIFGGWFRRDEIEAAHRRVIGALDAVLREPPFSDVAWMTSEQYEASPA